MTRTAEPTWRRAFIALWPDAASRQALALSRPPATPGVRPLHPDDLHLTVAFLGDLHETIAAALVAGLRGVAWPVLDLNLDSQPTERWPDAARPRVLVLPYTPTPALLRLHDTVRQTVQSAGLPVEARPYRPHVTLARLARKASAEPHACPATSRFVRLALCHGVDAAPGEPRYRVIAPLSLAGPTHPVAG